MSIKEPITRNTSLSDFKKLIAEGNDEAWNIVSDIISRYKYEVIENMIGLDLRGEQIVTAYINHGSNIDSLVYWIMSKYENKDI